MVLPEDLGKSKKKTKKQVVSTQCLTLLISSEICILKSLVASYIALSELHMVLNCLIEVNETFTARNG